MIESVLRTTRILRNYRGSLAIALLAALGGVAADLLQPWPLKVLFDNVFRHKHLPTVLADPISRFFGPGKSGILSSVLFAVLAIAIVGAVCSFVQGLVTTRVATRVLYDLRRQLYWHMQGLALAYHDERRTGELISTLTADIQAVQDMVGSGLVGLVVSVLTLFGMIVVMFLLNWHFALLALSVAPLLFSAVYQFTRQIKQSTRAVRKQEGKITSIAQEVLSSIRVVQAFTREEYEQTRFERENQVRVDAAVQARTLQAALPSVVDVLVAVGTVLVLWYGAQRVLAKDLSTGSLLVFLAYLSRLYRPMRDLSKLTDVLYRASIGLERIFGVLETEQTVRDIAGARPAPALRGGISFDNVSFSYGRGTLALDSVSLDIAPGQIVALVGATGAGKSTLASMIPRFNDPAGGRVCIDGKDIREYTLQSLRSQIALVLQETVLFYGSIYENIAYGRPDASPAAVLAAAEMANAKQFIDELPDGYDTLVGERGVTLSGGQRQRIAIARAIIREAPILLLDEPTTGLDATAEALVIDALGRLLLDRTALVIAHRLTTISRADLIMVMDNGQIVERGTHAELLRKGDRYAHLYDLQFRGQASVEPVVGVVRD